MASLNDSLELPFLSIREAADLIRARMLSPVELTEALLTRIERLNPRLNSYITVTIDWARERARTAEAEIAAGTLSRTAPWDPSRPERPL